MKIFSKILSVVFLSLYFVGVYLYIGEDTVISLLAGYSIPEIVFHTCNALLCFILVFQVSYIFEHFTRKFLSAIVKKTSSDIDDILVDIFFSLLHVIKYLIAFYIAWQLIEAPLWLNNLVEEFSSIAGLVILLLFVTRFVNLVFTESLIEKSRMKAMSKTLLPFVRRIIIALIWIIGVITIVANLGYDVTALVAGAGVGGIALALAAQQSVSNMFGALTILANRPFNIGDYITINGTTGTVKDIGLTYITLVDRLGHNVMIPNESFISSSIDNQSRRSYRRADFAIGLIYDTTLAQMQKGVKIIEEILEKYVEEKVLQSYRVNFEAFGDFSLNINVTYFSNTKNYTEFVKEKEEINLEIKKRFAKSKLEMAFPTQEMIIKGGDLK